MRVSDQATRDIRSGIANRGERELHAPPLHCSTVLCTLCKATTVMTDTTLGDDSLVPTYRAAKPISFELVQHSGIFFEEKLC